MKLIEAPIVTKAENTNEIIELRKHSGGATKPMLLPLPLAFMFANYF
jgi:hypothetical protein